MATITLPPDYFRTAAEKFSVNPGNRKVWLKDQLAKANQSLIQYQIELNQIGLELLHLGAVKGQAQGLATVGTVLAVIPAGYTQVIGGLAIVGSALLSKVENKQKSKRIADLQTVGNAKLNEATRVGEYKSKYERELLYLNLVPVLLVAVLIWLILK
jgi:hypothetical protein